MHAPMSGDMHRRCNIKPPPPCSRFYHHCMVTACMQLTFHSLHAELGVIPPAGAISEVSLINRQPESQSPPDPSLNLQLHLPAVSYYKEGCSIFIGAATPPVPPKLVERIKAGEFIDMAELLPDRMGTSKSFIADESTKQKSRRRPVSIWL